MWEQKEEQFIELISADAIQARVKALGDEITKDYKEIADRTILVAVLKGSVMFFADLARAVHLPVALDFIGISSYGDNTESSGVVQLTTDVSHSIENKHVIIVEDIIDTGLTAHYLLENFRTRNPASIKLCSLLHKPDRTTSQVHIDYLGFPVPDKFVVGYGLDIAQKYRNLPYIGYKP